MPPERMIVLDLAKLQWFMFSTSTFLLKNKFIPRAKGRARTRAARDFLKTIVAILELETWGAMIPDPRTQNAVAFIRFLLEFSFFIWQRLPLSVTVSCSSDYPFFELSLLHPKLAFQPTNMSNFGHEFPKLNDVSVRLFLWFLTRLRGTSKHCKSFARVQKYLSHFPAIFILSFILSVRRVNCRYSIVVLRPLCSVSATSIPMHRWGTSTSAKGIPSHMMFLNFRSCWWDSVPNLRYG